MTDIIEKIRKAARVSSAATIHWPGRGPAPLGYVEGMAVTFGRLQSKLDMGDAIVVEMARQDMGDASRDVLAHYSQQFAALGMDNSVAGIDTLRHLLVLMVGLGMRESSGRHCEGRDMSAGNVTAETAEAGLFQTSWNARTAHASLVPLFVFYRNNPSGFVDIFKKGVNCSAASWQNWGEGDGVEFQQLSKACPAFATEFTALALRWRRRHWGPINSRAAELRVEWDDLLLQVQAIVDTTPGASHDLI